MKIKLLMLALASCLELVASSSSVQAQIFNRDRWIVDVESPSYQPAVYGKKGPGVYDNYGRRYLGLPDYGAAMNMYGFPNPVYPSLIPSPERGHPSPGPGTYSTGSVSNFTEIGIAGGATIATPSQPGSVSDKAEFRVKVPVPNAKVYFNDNLVEQEGTDRKLITPTLQSGTYTYRVRATWTENGQNQTQEQRLRVEPGRVVDVAFGVPVKP
jgi:uncharacterized protein (TIGR03000 family)